LDGTQARAKPLVRNMPDSVIETGEGLCPSPIDYLPE